MDCQAFLLAFVFSVSVFSLTATVCADPFLEFTLTAVSGSYSIPNGTSHDLCANYLNAVPGQCSPPTLSAAESLCAADSNCGGVNCHSDNNVCTLRYFPLTTPTSNTNYNFYFKQIPVYSFSALPNTTLSGSAAIPSGTSSNLCANYLTAVPGQCSPPTLQAAQTLCAADSNCGGVNCHSDNTVCTLRYFPLTVPTSNAAYNAYFKYL